MALTAAPGDEELLKLKEDLEQLLALSNALYQAEAPSSSDSKDVGRYYVGQSVEAVFKGDGLFYPAKIDAISSDGKKVTVSNSAMSTFVLFSVTRRGCIFVLPLSPFSWLKAFFL